MSAEAAAIGLNEVRGIHTNFGESLLESVREGCCVGGVCWYYLRDLNKTVPHGAPGRLSLRSESGPGSSQEDLRIQVIADIR